MHAQVDTPGPGYTRVLSLLALALPVVVVYTAVPFCVLCSRSRLFY
jgi:hypothetical protein